MCERVIQPFAKNNIEMTTILLWRWEYDKDDEKNKPINGKDDISKHDDENYEVIYKDDGTAIQSRM